MDVRSPKKQYYRPPQFVAIDGPELVWRVDWSDSTDVVQPGDAVLNGRVAVAMADGSNDGGGNRSKGKQTRSRRHQSKRDNQTRSETDETEQKQDDDEEAVVRALQSAGNQAIQQLASCSCMTSVPDLGGRLHTAHREERGNEPSESEEHDSRPSVSERQRTDRSGSNDSSDEERRSTGRQSRSANR